MSNYRYIAQELAEKTDKKSVKNAYNAGNLSIVVIDNRYYFEATDGRYQKTIDAEIKKHFPELAPIF